MQLSQSGVIPNNRYLGSGKNFPTLFPSSVCRNNSATFNKSIRYPLFLYLCSAFPGITQTETFSSSIGWISGCSKKLTPFVCFFNFSFDFLFLFVSCTFSNREHYFTSAAWVSQTEVSVVWMNRPQNLSVVTLCKSPMWYCQEVSCRVLITRHFWSCCQ